MEVNKDVSIVLRDREATLVKRFFEGLKHKQCMDIMISGADGDEVYILLQKIANEM